MHKVWRGRGGGCIFSFLSRLAEKLGGDELTGVLNENFVGTLEGERSRKKTKEKAPSHSTTIARFTPLCTVKGNLQRGGNDFTLT